MKPFSALLAIGTLALAGCNILPQAEVDPTRFYVLEAPATGAGATAMAAERPGVGLRPVEVPGYLRSRSIVVRSGENEIKFVDLERWAESLESSVARVVAERLGAKVDVIGFPFRGGAPRQADISVRLVNCEGTSEGGIRFVARYTITRPGTDGTSEVDTFNFTAPAANWNGRDYAQLAALLSNAAAQLGDDIAAKF